MKPTPLSAPHCFYEVAIVGAGPAGLSAAKEFLSHGVKSVVILEALDRIGGRVNTISTPDGPIEYGAQWIHGEIDNKLFDVAHSNQFIHKKSSLDGNGDFLTEKGEKIPDEVVEEFFEAATNFILSLSKSELLDYSDKVEKYASIGDFYYSQFKTYLDSCSKDSPLTKHLKTCLYHYLMRWERIDNACDSLHQLSARQWQDFQYCKGQDNMNPKYGMTSIIHNILGLNRPTIKTNSEVINISYLTEMECTKSMNGFSSPVMLTCRDGATVGCNHAIVTCSIGHLKSRPQLFSPPLPPPLRMAIDNTGYGTLNKIFLVFDHQWWDEDTIGFQFVWTEKIPNFDRTFQELKFVDGTEAKMEDFWPYAITGFDPLFDGRPILCGWIGGPEAEYMETLADNVVMETCLALLCKFLGKSNLPQPVRIFRSKWFSDPFFRGSYCHRGNSPTQDSFTPTELDKPVYASDSQNKKVPVIALAGEANSVHYFSTVHGAMANGQSQAQHYLNYRKGLVEDLNSKL